jgi:hypothetical protein
MGGKPGFIVGSEQERFDRLVQAQTDPDGADDDRNQDKRFHPGAKATNECAREILPKNRRDCDACGHDHNHCDHRRKKPFEHRRQPQAGQEAQDDGRKSRHDLNGRFDLGSKIGVHEHRCIDGA